MTSSSLPDRNLVARAAAFLFLTVALVAFAQDADPSTLAGHWEGEIALPTGDLQVMVDLELVEGAWRGTIDIPMQGAQDLPLAEISVAGDEARFSIAGIPGNPTFAGMLDGGELRGNFTQGLATFPFRLGRDAVAPPARPQEPQPPYPYGEEEVSFTNGDVTLAGTITLPSGDGPFPAVVLVTGSGPQDRDEALFGHKPFKVLADHLTRRGIAVLRYDDRGVGGSSGNTTESTSVDFAGDALAGVAFLAARPKVAAGRVGLLGHSEGGLVAPIAAARSEAVAFVVLLAGPGVPGEEILVRQNELLARAAGTPDDQVAAQLALQREAFDLLRGEKDEEALRAKLGDVLHRQLALQAGTELGDDERKALEEQGERQIDFVLSPWFRYFLDYDPRGTLAKVKVPVLALNGGLDLQVDPDQNLPAIEAALKGAGNSDVTVQKLPGLNHLFQAATTGLVQEYAQIEETMSPDALEAISGWILERFGPPAKPMAKPMK